MSHDPGCLDEIRGASIQCPGRFAIREGNRVFQDHSGMMLALCVDVSDEGVLHQKLLSCPTIPHLGDIAGGLGCGSFLRGQRGSVRTIRDEHRCSPSCCHQLPGFHFQKMHPRLAQASEVAQVRLLQLCALTTILFYQLWHQRLVVSSATARRRLSHQADNRVAHI